MKAFGKHKDESGNKVMPEFFSLQAKLYGYQMDDDNVTMKNKGVKKNVVKRDIVF